MINIKHKKKTSSRPPWNKTLERKETLSQSRKEKKDNKSRIDHFSGIKLYSQNKLLEIGRCTVTDAFGREEQDRTCNHETLGTHLLIMWLICQLCEHAAPTDQGGRRPWQSLSCWSVFTAHHRSLVKSACVNENFRGPAEDLQLGYLLPPASISFTCDDDSRRRRWRCSREAAGSSSGLLPQSASISRWALAWPCGSIEYSRLYSPRSGHLATHFTAFHLPGGRLSQESASSPQTSEGQWISQVLYSLENWFE